MLKDPFKLLFKLTFLGLLDLNLDFAFSSKLAEMAFGPVFKSIAASMVVAFTERAKKIYL